MPQATLRNTRRLIVTLIALLTAAIAVQTATAGDQPDGPVLHEGNPNCVELGYELGFKPNFGATGETPPKGDAVTVSDGTLEVTIKVTGLNGAGEATTIEWSSNIGVDAVIMKGGDDGFVYVYDPPAEATSGSGLTTPLNNGGNRPEISHIEFCYDVDGGELDIVKTAETRSFIEYDWKIEKTVDRPEIVLTKEPTSKATYTVTVTKGEGVEHGWQVWGDITVTNNTDAPATIVSVSDELTGHGDVDVSCEGPALPVDLGPGGTLVCSYGPVQVSDGSARENTATVATRNGGKVAGASHTVPVVFGEPHKLNPSVTVIDDYATPEYEGDDIWWEFSETKSVIYERTFWCKEAGRHTNTARIIGFGQFDGQLAAPDEIEQRYAQATVDVWCDTKKGGTPLDDGGIDAKQPAGPVGKPLVPSATSTDIACKGADSVRGSRGDSAWGLIGPKGYKTTFFLSKRSYWKVLKLKSKASNPYFRLGAAYTMAKLHRLNGTPSTRAVERSMSWVLRYLETHRAGYSKFRPKATPERKRTIKRLHRVMRKHTRVLERYATAMDKARCTS